MGEIIMQIAAGNDQEPIRNRPGANKPGGWVVQRMGQAPPAPSGRKRQGAQSSQCAAELGFPGPAPGQMQSEAAGLAGEPSGQGEEPPPQGLGGYYLLTETDARRPLHGSLGGHPPQPGYPGLLPEAAVIRQAKEAGVGRVHAQTAGHTQLHAQKRLPLVRYDSAGNRSFLLTFKTVAKRCSFSGVGSLCKNHYPRFTGALSYPFRTLT